MKKSLLVLILAVLLLVSCDSTKTGGSETTAATDNAVTTAVKEQKVVDVADAAAKIYEKANFAITLDLIDAENVAYISGYGTLPPDTKCAVYMSGGANAEEVAVFSASDNALVKEAINAHIAEQSAAFASYKPEDIPKLEKAVIYEKNGVVALVVTADTALATSVCEEVIG